MRRVTISTADIIAPVFATTKVVPLFLAGMAAQAGLGRIFRGFVFERNDLRGIAFGDMVLARTMTRFAAGDLTLPTADRGKLGVRGVRVRFELVLVTVFAGFAADVTCVANLGQHGRL